MYINPVGAGLPAKAACQPTTLCLTHHLRNQPLAPSLRHEPVQYAVDCQFAQHDHLLYSQQGIALRSIDKSGEVAGHDAGRGQ